MSRIVVIDDDVGIQEALKAILEFDGHAVTIMTSDEGVYKYKEEQMPELIILDLLLSGRDGKTIARGLKGDNRTKDIPIVMLSAHPDAGKAAISAGADGFLAKPFDMQILLDTVKKYAKTKL